MWALPINLSHFVPWVSFIAGVGGSLHCVGMCGGLVTASCDKTKDLFRYQLGRLLGYLTLGLLAGYLGSLVQLQNKSPLITLIPGLFIGSLFLFWGVQALRGKKAPLPAPRFIGKMYTFFWKNLVHKNFSFSKSFFTGFISLFLPCGLLYGVVLGALALQHPLMALTSMFFFWLGTLPSMLLAPKIFQQFLAPFKKGLPKTYAIGLILLGLFTVSFRVAKFNQLHQHEKNEAGSSHNLNCH